MSFAEWFVIKCNEMGVAPSNVGTAVGKSAASACGWASGKYNPSRATLAKIEEYFGEKYDENKKATDNVDGKSELDMEIESLLAQISEDKKRIVLAMLRGAAMSE